MEGYEVSVRIKNIPQTVISGQITAELNGKFSAGGTTSCQLDAVILPVGNFADDDPLTVFIRPPAKHEEEVPDWIPLGTFYIDTNPVDAITGAMEIHAYDAMLMMEQPLLTKKDTPADWPQSPEKVMARIADAIGVPLDPRNFFGESDDYLIPYPTENSIRPPEADTSLCLNTKTKIIHYKSCSRVAQIDTAHYQEPPDGTTVASLVADGYKPCGTCNPSDGNAADDSAPLTMRAVASYIAAMHGGNWAVTPQNTLYLVPLDFPTSVSRIDTRTTWTPYMPTPAPDNPNPPAPPVGPRTSPVSVITGSDTADILSADTSNILLFGNVAITL